MDTPNTDPDTGTTDNDPGATDATTGDTTGDESTTLEPSSTPTDAPPTDKKERRTRVHRDSLVLVHTGNGKGKSSSAFGVALRALARGWRVRVVQFLKSGNWRTGEATMLPQLGAEWWEAGDGFTWDSEDLDESQALALAAWEDTKARLREDDLDLLVLDEVTYPINWGWIDLDDVVQALQTRSDKVHVVITGRDCPAELIELADTVTEMREVKHAFHEGVIARRGIDY